mmetsp:Transcript_91400/g.295657  ORF Transcript_91400/g.295657 Transcript_91400/m.295657 type:complete len:260 (+) Transcript_91400:831-1610(+)
MRLHPRARVRPPWPTSPRRHPQARSRPPRPTPPPPPRRPPCAIARGRARRESTRHSTCGMATRMWMVGGCIGTTRCCRIGTSQSMPSIRSSIGSHPRSLTRRICRPAARTAPETARRCTRNSGTCQRRVWTRPCAPGGGGRIGRASATMPSAAPTPTSSCPRCWRRLRPPASVSPSTSSHTRAGARRPSWTTSGTSTRPMVLTLPCTGSGVCLSSGCMTFPCSTPARKSQLGERPWILFGARRLMVSFCACGWARQSGA